MVGHRSLAARIMVRFHEWEPNDLSSVIPWNKQVESQSAGASEITNFHRNCKWFNSDIAGKSRTALMSDAPRGEQQPTRRFKSFRWNSPASLAFWKGVCLTVHKPVRIRRSWTNFTQAMQGTVTQWLRTEGSSLLVVQSDRPVKYCESTSRDHSIACTNMGDAGKNKRPR